MIAQKTADIYNKARDKILQTRINSKMLFIRNRMRNDSMAVYNPKNLKNAGKCVDHILDSDHCESHDEDSEDEMQEFMDKLQVNNSDWLEDEKYMAKLISRLNLNLKIDKKNKSM